MKKVLFFFSAVMMLTFQTSCSVDDNPAPNPVQEDLAEATIMWYGTGGSNVDGLILENFRQFYKAQSKNFDHVNVVAQYKTSYDPTVYNSVSYEETGEWAENEVKTVSDEQLETYDWFNYFLLCHPKKGETYRFAIDPKKPMYKTFRETEPYGEPNADFTNPDSLTSFINWAAQNYPAKKYILVFAIDLIAVVVNQCALLWAAGCFGYVLVRHVATTMVGHEEDVLLSGIVGSRPVDEVGQ